MMYVTMDGRDGTGGSSGSCSVCCCEPIIMRPGETNLLQLNYAPWSLPIAQGGPGVVPYTEISVEIDNSTCSTGQIDGFGPPVVPTLEEDVALNTDTAITFVPTPVGNTFSTVVMSLYGPYHGTVTPVDPNNPTNGQFSYSPVTGFVGYDSFYVKTTDAQGRSTVSFVVLKVGAPTTLNPNPPRLGLYIDPMKIKIDPRFQTVSMVLQLGPDAQQCQVFHVNIRQPARSCDDLYYHLACFDVHVGKC